ncbi:hypothetical protein MTR_7g029180 [Medicago truncatula]|uniref:Endonuclease/exonuclease/phosphatase family protein n=1 Tax=Medicago truncatula TaxID=3880 RepID=A0A072TX67_MEDTR|nr:hypothetical protein MTR_7g029180 [Medicago truncatula]
MTSGLWILEWFNSQYISVDGDTLPTVKNVTNKSSSTDDQRVTKKKSIRRIQALWDNISNRLVSFDDQNICVCGDFNAVRCGTERRSVGTSYRDTGTIGLNQFIDDNLLIDLLFGVAIILGLGGMENL